MTSNLSPIAHQIWDEKYRLGTGTDQAERSIEETFQRVARAVAKAEPKDARSAWAHRFYEAMVDFEFIPAGRILAGAGSRRKVTLFNCFVMGKIGDSLNAIFENVKEAALTMQQGGGIGHDFSTLRPRGAEVKGIETDASGPVSFMNVWDAMCRTIMSAGTRRGAMMATLRCDHPDIEAFVEAKADPAHLRMFNLSVLVTDAFMIAIAKNRPWNLVFNGKVYKTLPARELWAKITRSAYEFAEPGVIFIDRVNRENNLGYCENISATNPCGEQPLPPYGACLLGSINLAQLVRAPFTEEARLDEERLEALVPLAVRFLDDVISISEFPLDAQRGEALAKRRIGLGVTGLADALIFCRVHYGSDQAVKLGEHWMEVINRAAYRASAQLAAEKGTFPLYEVDRFKNGAAFRRLDPETQALVAQHGLRNGTLTSIAPTGTISLLAGNVSSGIEPVFDFTYSRRILAPNGEVRHETVTDYAYQQFRKQYGDDAELPNYFTTSLHLTPVQHLTMQSAFQLHVDASISKTVNCPENMSFAEFEGLYRKAYTFGLKGCTAYRPNPVTGGVLAALPPAAKKEGKPHVEKKIPEPPVSDTKVETAPVEEPTIPPLLAAQLSASLAEMATGTPTTEMIVEAETAKEPKVPPLLATQRSTTRLTPITSDTPTAPAVRTAGELVRLIKPLERDQTLPGFTYKLKWDSEHVVYITINDVVLDGRRRPFEIFINSKSVEHVAWTVALTRMISAIFRRGGDVSFVVDELKAVFDPRGGQWMNGAYVPSLLAAIGDIIRQHMVNIGFIAIGANQTHISAEHIHEAQNKTPTSVETTSIEHCPRCGSSALYFSEGCLNCRDCRYTKCN
jgi:ribonucleoside-diphosphate reductase alpha chain